MTLFYPPHGSHQRLILLLMLDLALTSHPSVLLLALSPQKSPSQVKPLTLLILTEFILLILLITFRHSVGSRGTLTCGWIVYIFRSGRLNKLNLCQRLEDLLSVLLGL